MACHAERRHPQDVATDAQPCEKPGFDGQREAAVGSIAIDPNPRRQLDSFGGARVSGRTYGIELFLQRSFSNRLAGWVGYTVSRADRWIGSLPYLSPFDRTHVVSGVLDYDFGAGIRGGLRATFYSGRPDIPSFFFAGQSATFAFGPGQLPQHRLPPFYRFDVRAEKRWKFGAREWIAVVFDFFNATLTKEAIAFRCDVVARMCTARQVGPIALPSIGVEGGL